MTKLMNTDFIGVIQEGTSNDYRGKYKVYIRELMVSDRSLKPIWAKNEVMGNRFSRWLDINDKQVKTAGSYYPLQPGMEVNVRFRGETFESAYISNVIAHVPLVDKPSLRDEIHIINKTINGSWIYQDDSRQFTHIMQSNGRSNIILDNKSITLAYGLPNPLGGIITASVLSVGDDGTRLDFGDNSIAIDETGISFHVGDTTFALTESGIKMIGNTLEMAADKDITIRGNNTNITGSSSMNLYSNVCMISGTTRAVVTGGDITLNSAKNTTIKSTMNVNVDGLIKTKISGGLIDLAANVNLSISSPIMTLDGTMLTLSGTTTVLGSSALMIDGTILHGMGVASGIASGMKAANLGVNIGSDAANIGIIASTSNSDMISGIVNATLTQALPGSATPVGNIVKPVKVNSKSNSGISEKVGYILSADASYSTVVEGQFKGLRETHEFI